MKYLLRIFILFSLHGCVLQMHAQLLEVKYALSFNPSTNLFDCYLFVEEGKATTVFDRIQFNSQFSLTIPTGADVEVATTYMPLIDNKDYQGSNPIQWNITSKLVAPEIAPHLDFYGITPNLAPVGFYNNLQKGDLVKLFSISVEGIDRDIKNVKIFNNENNLRIKEVDFSNGFTAGRFEQLYKGNIDLKKE